MPGSSSSVGAVARPMPPVRRRRRPLRELVRDLSGWTLPPRQPDTAPLPDGWRQAWATASL